MEGSSTVDPFRAVQEEVSRGLQDIQSQVVKWQKLTSKSPKYEPSRQQILSSLAELQVDLQDMQRTIDMALKDPAKWALTPSELMSRQTFVRDLQAQANDARDTLDPSPIPSGRQGSGRFDSQGPGCGLCAGSSTGGASSSSGASQSAAQSDNDAMLGASQQQQHEIIAVQEQELGVLSSSLDRLGHMGKVMNEEMRAQGRELELFTSEVDSASSKMTQATVRACGAAGASRAFGSGSGLGLGLGSGSGLGLGFGVGAQILSVPVGLPRRKRIIIRALRPQPESPADRLPST